MVSRQRLDQLKTPEKTRARNAVARALRTGRLMQSVRCEQCGAEGVRLHAHHHIGYEPEHWLEVRFICTACHGLIHRRGRKPPIKKEPTTLIGKYFSELGKRRWLGSTKESRKEAMSDVHAARKAKAAERKLARPRQEE